MHLLSVLQFLSLNVLNTSEKYDWTYLFEFQTTEDI